MGRGEHCKQIPLVCVWGVLTVCLDHTGFAPTHDVCAFPVYMAQAPGCSAGELSKAGPGFHALEKEMATHSSVLAWRIPGTGEPGGLPSVGSHRVRHD